MTVPSFWNCNYGIRLSLSFEPAGNRGRLRDSYTFSTTCQCKPTKSQGQENAHSLWSKHWTVWGFSGNSCYGHFFAQCLKGSRIQGNQVAQCQQCCRQHGFHPKPPRSTTLPKIDLLSNCQQQSLPTWAHVCSITWCVCVCVCVEMPLLGNSSWRCPGQAMLPFSFPPIMDITFTYYGLWVLVSKGRMTQCCKQYVR